MDCPLRFLIAVPIQAEKCVNRLPLCPPKKWKPTLENVNIYVINMKTKPDEIEVRYYEDEAGHQPFAKFF
jgi:hypothetical protein